MFIFNSFFLGIQIKCIMFEIVFNIFKIDYFYNRIKLYF